MKKSKKSAGLKAAIILTIIFLVAFIGAFVAFGFVATYVDDADIDNGFMAIFQYLLKAFPDIFTFQFHDPNSYAYIALSGGLYFVLGLAFIYLIVGIIISSVLVRYVAYSKQSTEQNCHCGYSLCYHAGYVSPIPYTAYHYNERAQCR